MPFAFIFVGVVLTISGVNGKSQALYSLLKSDLVGKNSYLYWAISIMVIGALGYSDDLKPLSRSFLVLVLVVLVLANGGFFNLFNQSIATITASNSSTPTTNPL